jgi:hypothetical protein
VTFAADARVVRSTVVANSIVFCRVATATYALPAVIVNDEMATV